MVTEINNLQPYAEAASASLAQAGPDWLNLFRKRAWDGFAANGFPTTRHEEWKYTNVRPIVEGTFSSAISGKCYASQVESLIGSEGIRLVFVNGLFDIGASSVAELPNGLTISSLKDVLAKNSNLVKPHLANYASFEDDMFVALNTATFVDGAFIHVSASQAIETPIFIVNITEDGSAAQVRNLIVLEQNAQATVVEAFLSDGDKSSFTNAVTEIVLADGAHLNHTKTQVEGLSANHIAYQVIEQAKSSVFDSQNICFGASLARTTIYARLGAERIECTVDGLYCVNGRQHVDNHTAIDHAFPNCNSFELYKGVMDGKSTGVFNGKIFVRQDAQKTDSKQTNQNILLSEEATINTKPQLEIFADDVRCTHGATVGHLDSAALFYLRARGIGEAEARSMLIHAFANEVLERIKPEHLRVAMEQILNDKLAG
ncbi:MAG: Fe-S cluster assembly protein SufD [Chthonomonadales bacterium]